MTLVGTSVLKNTAQVVIETWRSKYSDLDNWHNMSLADSRNIYPDGLLCKLDLVEPDLYSDMLDAAVSLGERASAEVSGLVGIASSRGHSRSDVEILLLPTGSCTSVLSSKLNRQLAIHLGFASVKISVVERLGRFETFEEGLVDLLNTVVLAIKEARERGQRVFVNATPGFKAESSFLVLASLLAGADGVVYLHETFREPIYIPAVPIKIDDQFASLVKRIMPDGRISREEWGYVDITTRQMLEERGIVKCEKDVCKVNPWIKSLVDKLS